MASSTDFWEIAAEADITNNMVKLETSAHIREIGKEISANVI